MSQFKILMNYLTKDGERYRHNLKTILNMFPYADPVLIAAVLYDVQGFDDSISLVNKCSSTATRNISLNTLLFNGLTQSGENFYNGLLALIENFNHIRLPLLAALLCSGAEPRPDFNLTASIGRLNSLKYSKKNLENTVHLLKKTNILIPMKRELDDPQHANTNAKKGRINKEKEEDGGKNEKEEDRGKNVIKEYRVKNEKKEEGGNNEKNNDGGEKTEEKKEQNEREKKNKRKKENTEYMETNDILTDQKITEEITKIKKEK